MAEQESPRRRTAAPDIGTSATAPAERVAWVGRQIAGHLDGLKLFTRQLERDAKASGDEFVQMQAAAMMADFERFEESTKAVVASLAANPAKPSASGSATSGGKAGA